MPWDTVTRLVERYGLAKRDAETLVGLDEYEGKGVAYFEDVVQGDVKLGKKASNWCVLLKAGLMSRIAHELLGQLGKTSKEWTADVVPSGIMRELVQAVEDGTITGMPHISVEIPG
jgi:aspartyl-tRNA(Asn)/glutamyl-tRNA(Gln) amidotransferase subunit B